MDSPILPGSVFLQACFYLLALAIVIAATILVKIAAQRSGDSPAEAAGLQRRFMVAAVAWVAVVSAASYSGLLERLKRHRASARTEGADRPSAVPRWIVTAWNVMGLALLTTIVSLSVASSPAFAAFGPDRLNVFVTWMPYTLLPTVMVLAAWAGHLIVFRALR